MNTLEVRLKIEELQKQADEALYVDSSRSLILCLESLKLAEAAKETALQFQSHKLLANVYCNMGSFVEALQHYNEMLQVSQKTGDKSQTASAFAGIGLVAKQTGDWELSLDSYNKALSLFRENGMIRDEAGMLMNIGNVFSRKRDFAISVQYQKKALKLYEKLGDILGQSRVLNNLGTSFTRVDQPKAGVIYFKKALKLIERMGKRSEEAISLLNIGLCYGEPQENPVYNTKLAIPFLKKSLTISESMNLQHIMYTGYDMLAGIYADKGYFKRAYDYHVKFHRVKEQVFNEESDEKLKKLQAVHKTDQAKKEAEILRLQNEKLAEDIERGKSELSVANS